MIETRIRNLREYVPAGRRRSQAGNSISEAPAALWVLILAICFPMVNYCSLGIRSAMVFSACNQACLTASKARSYEVGTAEAPSAIQIANSTAQLCANSWTGIHLSSVSTRIITTNINSLIQTKQQSKLALPPNTADNTFQLEVTISAAVDPFINVAIPFLNNLQGISAPYQLTVTQRNYFENTQGLMR